MKLNLPLKMLPVEINFYLEVTANQNVIKSPILGFSANFDLYVNS